MQSNSTVKIALLGGSIQDRIRLLRITNDWSPESEAAYCYDVGVNSKPCYVEVVSPLSLDNMRDMSVRDSQVLLLLFSPYDKATFESLINIRLHLLRTTDGMQPFLMIVAMLDSTNTEREREISSEAGLTLAKRWGVFYTEVVGSVDLQDILAPHTPVFVRLLSDPEFLPYRRRSFSRRRSSSFTYTLSMSWDEDEDGVPLLYKCPISQEIMKDPVLACDGFVYDREFIERWFEDPRSSSTNDKTNVRSKLVRSPLTNTLISPNTVNLSDLKDEIDRFRCSRTTTTLGPIPPRMRAVKRPSCDDVRDSDMFHIQEASFSIPQRFKLFKSGLSRLIPHLRS